MRVYTIESHMLVPGRNPWLPWSGTHWYKTRAEAEAAMAKLAHKHHPIPTEFRVRAYEPVSGSSEAPKP